MYALCRGTHLRMCRFGLTGGFRATISMARMSALGRMRVLAKCRSSQCLAPVPTGPPHRTGGTSQGQLSAMNGRLTPREKACIAARCGSTPSHRGNAVVESQYVAHLNRNALRFSFRTCPTGWPAANQTLAPRRRAAGFRGR